MLVKEITQNSFSNTDEKTSVLSIQKLTKQGQC
jgi:hypothetical protein